MNRISLILAVAMLWAVPAGADSGPAKLRVRIENISARGGILRLGLYTQATYYDDKAAPVAGLDVPAAAPAQEFELAPVPPGIYAIQVLQDFNGNGKMDFNWAGLPLKPYGFSRDAKAYVAKPDFARVKITLAPGQNSILIHLQNSDAPSPGKGDGRKGKGP